jgi:hypothetical protein
MFMRLVRSKFSAALIAGAAGLVPAVVAPNAASAQAMTLQGVWYVTTQPVNCDTGLAMGPPHRALVTYHAGGTLSDTSAVQAFIVGQRTDGHGVWSHTGRHTYTANWVAMIVLETPQNTPPGSPGFVPGWQVGTNTITLTGPDTFVMERGVSRFVNLAGDVYRVACASRVGERFE